jgi:hypothetical protein
MWETEELLAAAENGQQEFFTLLALFSFMTLSVVKII